MAYDSYWEFAARLPSGEGIADHYAIEYDTTTGSDNQVLFTQHAQKMAAKSSIVDREGKDQKEGGKHGE